MNKKLHLFTCRSGMGSDRCRGMDIAEKMGMPCDAGFQDIKDDDVVVMVKHFSPEVLKITKSIYVDIVDGCRGDTYDKIRRHENVTVITLTPSGAKWIKENWFPNHRVIWIPHTHCNNENRFRPPGRSVNTIMYNGTENGFHTHHWHKFASMARYEGFKVTRFHTIAQGCSSDLRKDCCDAYFACDIQVAFRPPYYDAELPLHLKSPTKLNNAGSFRIPSVAYPEVAFTHNYDRAGHFLRADTIEEMIQCCIKLRDETETYDSLAFSAWYHSQSCHIDKVVKYYERLL